MKGCLGLRHAALPVTDLPRALAFYTEVLGFTPYHVTDSDWAMVSMGSTTLSLIPVKGAAPDRRAGVHPAHLGLTFLSAREIDEVHARLKARGVKGLGEPILHRDRSFGFYLRDPDDNALELIFIPALPPAVAARRSAQLTLLIAHGSSDPRWAQPFEALVHALREHAPGVRHELCYMEFQSPTLPEALTRALAAQPVTEVVVVPLFMSSGGHVPRDVQGLVDAAARANPGVTFELAPAIGESPLVREAMLSAILGRPNG